MMRRLAGLAGTSIRTSGCADPSGPWSRWSRGQQGRGRPARRPEDGPCWWQAADWESVLLLGFGRRSLGGRLAQKITFGFSLGQRVEGSKRTTTTKPPALAAAATLNIECRE